MLVVSVSTNVQGPSVNAPAVRQAVASGIATTLQCSDCDVAVQLELGQLLTSADPCAFVHLNADWRMNSTESSHAVAAVTQVVSMLLGVPTSCVVVSVDQSHDATAEKAPQYLHATNLQEPVEWVEYTQRFDVC